MARVADDSRRPSVPVLLLRRFADPEGRVLMERRDRTRRVLAPVETAAREAGTYALPAGRPGAGALADLLARVETAADLAMDRVVAGAFPPSPADRGVLALLVGLLFLLGRGHREALAAGGQALGTLIETTLTQGEDEAWAETEAGPAPEGEPGDGPTALVETEAAGGPQPVGLRHLPLLARLLAARTWQLLRFPAPLVLTGDTPVILWRRPDAPGPARPGLGGADEVRLALDPRHGLVLARVAPAGEVVRDVEARHARALNRTLADAARRWLYYRPDTDPLEGVELSPPLSP